MPTILGKVLDGRQPLVRVRLSNDFPDFTAADPQPPATVRRFNVWALIDTGATNRAIDAGVQTALMLPQQSVKQVIYPNMTDTVFSPAFTCAFGLMEHYSAGSKCHEWADLLEVLTFDLQGRVYQAVLGMDLLAWTCLSLDEAKSLSIRF